MGRKIKRHARLLERMFSRSEWEYLKRDAAFKSAINSFNASKDETLEDVEALALLGDVLLQKWEDANPKKSKFRKVKPSQRKPRQS